MAKLIDMTGQKWGRLTVLKRYPKNSNSNHAQWECKCDCGKEVVVVGRDLRSGNTKSCGCLAQEKISERSRAKLEGQRFGRLVAIKPNGKQGSNILWECKCDCGALTLVTSNSLLQGKTQSCGCLSREKFIERSKKDLTNQTFGKLLVLEATEERKGSYIVWKCQCACGNICYVTTNNLTTGKTFSCGCIHSRGEEYIGKILSMNNISYQSQKSYSDCVSPSSGRVLRFDFYVENKYLIEYDGILHFQTENRGWNSEEMLKKTQLHDAIKNKYCLDNNIPLIRIPYTHLSKLCLEDLLLETSQFAIKKQED